MNYLINYGIKSTHIGYKSSSSEQSRIPTLNAYIFIGITSFKEVKAYYICRIFVLFVAEWSKLNQNLIWWKQVPRIINRIQYFKGKPSCNLSALLYVCVVARSPLRHLFNKWQIFTVTDLCFTRRRQITPHHADDRNWSQKIRIYLCLCYGRCFNGFANGIHIRKNLFTSKTYMYQSTVWLMKCICIYNILAICSNYTLMEFTFDVFPICGIIQGVTRSEKFIPCSNDVFHIIESFLIFKSSAIPLIRLNQC